jgi:hypothetical protein
MNAIPPPRPFPGRKPYTPEKPKGAKAMTIAIGLLCNDGEDLVIASDRQFTVDGLRKRYARKLVSNGLDIVYGFAGDPGLFAEARQKISGFLDNLKPSDVSLDLIQTTIEGVLKKHGLA